VLYIVHYSVQYICTVYMYSMLYSVQYSVQYSAVVCSCRFPYHILWLMSQLIVKMMSARTHTRAHTLWSSDHHSTFSYVIAIFQYYTHIYTAERCKNSFY